MELSIPLDVHPAPRPKPSPKSAGGLPPPKNSPPNTAVPCLPVLSWMPPPPTSRHGCKAPEASVGVQVWGEEGISGECESWHGSGGPERVLYPGEVGRSATPLDPPAVGYAPWHSGCGAPVCLVSWGPPEAGSDPRGHLGVTWGVYLCAGKPPLADIILSHPPDLTRCDSVIGLAIPAMSGHIQYRSAAS